jgi:hypothetical protein
MSKYTIANQEFDEAALRTIYVETKQLDPKFNWKDLDCIFEIALKNKDRFPTINLQNKQNYKLYIERWVKGYYDAVNNPPSKRKAKPKATCNDPAIKNIVKSTQHLTEEEATLAENNHNLFMSAENNQGNLLEEYIAFKIRPYGFLWCQGNVLRAIDFCNTDGSFFLQIKKLNLTKILKAFLKKFHKDYMKL